MFCQPANGDGYGNLPGLWFLAGKCKRLCKKPAEETGMPVIFQAGPVVGLYDRFDFGKMFRIWQNRPRFRWCVIWTMV